MKIQLRSQVEVREWVLARARPGKAECSFPRIRPACSCVAEFFYGESTTISSPHPNDTVGYLASNSAEDMEDSIPFLTKKSKDIGSVMASLFIVETDAGITYHASEMHGFRPQCGPVDSIKLPHRRSDTVFIVLDPKPFGQDMDQIELEAQITAGQQVVQIDIGFL